VSIEKQVEHSIQQGHAAASLPAAVQRLGEMVALLIPGGLTFWEVHCHIRRDENGCTDVHVHTCTARQEGEKTGQPPEHAGYL
jgi:hypothetical protein